MEFCVIPAKAVIEKQYGRIKQSHIKKFNQRWCRRQPQVYLWEVHNDTRRHSVKHLSEVRLGTQDPSEGGEEGSASERKEAGFITRAYSSLIHN